MTTNLDAIIRCATAHGETSDTRQVISDLSDMLRAAWELMTPEQRGAFAEDANVLGIIEAAGGLGGTGANGSGVGESGVGEPGAGR